jgi:hypothetical protein
MHVVHAWRAALPLLGVALLQAACASAPPRCVGTCNAPYPTNSKEAPAPRGLGASTNDPQVLARLSDALDCPPSEQPFGISKCEAWNRWWREAATGATPQLAYARDLTYVNLLEDDNARVRFAAAVKLWSSDLPHCTDPLLATRIIAAAERETDAKVLDALGFVLATVDLEKTGIWLRTSRLAQAKADALSAFYSIVIARDLNKDFRPAVKFMMNALATEREISRAAGALANYHGAFLPEVCAFLVETLASRNLDVVSATVAALAWHEANGRCEGTVGALLHALGVHVLSGQLADTMDWAHALTNACQSPTATAQDKERAGQIAEALAGNAKFRYFALDAVKECETAGWREFVGRYVDDPTGFIGGHARSLLGP